MLWRKVTLMGVGLLGGSLGMALRKLALAERVYGYVRRPASIAECVQAGAVDSASTNLAEAVRGADLVVLCTPLAQMPELVRAALHDLAPGTLVTDVGSVKGELVRQLEPMLAQRGVLFVGSHPMAGSEKTGVGAAKEDLFQNAICVVTPTAQAPEEQVRRTEALWRSVGGRTLRLSPEEHDELVARSSHLPHVLAAHLAGYVLDPHRGVAQPRLCANGFRDSTRIALGSPEMWRDIVLMNKNELQRALSEFKTQLGRFEALLEAGDAERIEGIFRVAKTLRDGWIAGEASPSPE
jgi:prephenate dehydrogenase